MHMDNYEKKVEENLKLSKTNYYKGMRKHYTIKKWIRTEKKRKLTATKSIPVQTPNFQTYKKPIPDKEEDQIDLKKQFFYYKQKYLNCTKGRKDNKTAKLKKVTV